jgi:multiple sugar transport system substrate-binding protein
MSFESYIVFYNKDHVNKYLGGKLPETMDELIDMANKVKADSGGDVAGAVMRGLRTDTNIDTISGLVFNAWGARDIEGPYGVWFDGDWSKPRLDDPAIQKGLSDYAGLMAAGPSDILSYNWNEAGNAFCAGQAAFFADASLFGPWFETDDCPASKGNTGYITLPPQEKGGTSYTANWQWGIGMGANAQEKEAGWYFIQYMTNKASEAIIGTFHGGAGRLSTWENQEYTSTLNSDYVSATLESMKTVRTSVVPVDAFNKYALEIMDVILRIYNGASSADATAEGNANFKKM